MTNNEGVIITTRGLQLLTKLAASAGKLEFTKVKVGTGRPPDGTDPSGLTHLVMYKMDGLIADYGYDSEAMDGYVVMQISNAEIVSGFIMTEIGLYATDPDLGEILYAYVDLSNDPNHIMPAENGRSKTVQMKLHVIVGEVKELTATINPLAQVTRELLNKEIAAIVNPEFDASGTVEGITDKTSLLASFVTKMPLLKFLRNVVAGFKLVLYSGQIVNDCVTDRADLPGSAAQLKVLMDMLTVLNTKIDSVYPMGSIYMSVVNKNPSEFFGGTWVPWGTGRVPVGVNTGDSNFNAVEKTGGETSHKLTVSEMPSHTHVEYLRCEYPTGQIVNGVYVKTNCWGWSNQMKATAVASTMDTSTSSAGNNGSHNNLQPYITCYMWKRTA